jgi:tubulin epsilon
VLQALTEIVNKISQAVPSGKTAKRTYGPGSEVKHGSAIMGGDGGVAKVKEERPFDTMNNIVANLLLNLTRYVEGVLILQGVLIS